MYCVGLKWTELLTRTRVVIWFGKKERSESVLAGHLRYAVCAKRKLIYICIYIYTICTKTKPCHGSNCHQKTSQSLWSLPWNT